ncbi:Longin domain [Dillenia turbinata]|uniref:Longin domain n=1 Tax=Dillenia turbinata TaxID=194707 RepID=A0AAN8YXS4_9MAGN
MGQKSLIYAFVARGNELLVEFTEFTAYCVVADESIGRAVPIAFLEHIKDDFISKYGAGKAADAPAYSLNKEYGYEARARTRNTR